MDQVVASRDTESTVDKLEVRVGRTCINGTLVGGLAGLSLYAVSRAVGL